MENSKESTARWFYMMNYCKRNSLHPGDKANWEEARKAYVDFNLTKLENIGKILEDLVTEMERI